MNGLGLEFISLDLGHFNGLQEEIGEINLNYPEETRDKRTNRSTHLEVRRLCRPLGTAESCFNERRTLFASTVQLFRTLIRVLPKIDSAYIDHAHKASCPVSSMHRLTRWPSEADRWRNAFRSKF